MFSDSADVVMEEDCSYDEELSREEVYEYARLISVDPETEPNLMHIVRNGIKAKLPEHWKPILQDNGQIYYFNFSTSESTWEHPCDDIYRNMAIKERSANILHFNRNINSKLPPIHSEVLAMADSCILSDGTASVSQISPLPSSRSPIISPENLEEGQLSERKLSISQNSVEEGEIEQNLQDLGSPISTDQSKNSKNRSTKQQIHNILNTNQNDAKNHFISKICEEKLKPKLEKTAKTPEQSSTINNLLDKDSLLLDSVNFEDLNNQVAEILKFPEKNSKSLTTVSEINHFDTQIKFRRQNQPQSHPRPEVNIYHRLTPWAKSTAGAHAQGYDNRIPMPVLKSYDKAERSLEAKWQRYQELGSAGVAETIGRRRTKTKNISTPKSTKNGVSDEGLDERLLSHRKWLATLQDDIKAHLSRR